MIISPEDPLAIAVVGAIRDGDVESLARLLAENPQLASVRLGDDTSSRTLLHVATDWPGHFPNGAKVVRTLIQAGAEVDGRVVGSHHTETPLHWAASSDDVEVLDALLDAGADIEAPGAVIGGGTAVPDAAAFGQWKAGKRLIERGARTTLWEAAILGLLARLEQDFLGASPPPDEVTRAFWGACHGGAQTTAEFLLARGADPNWIGWDDLTPLDAAAREGHQDLVEWLCSQHAKSATELR